MQRRLFSFRKKILCLPSRGQLVSMFIFGRSYTNPRGTFYMVLHPAVQGFGSKLVCSQTSVLPLSLSTLNLGENNPIGRNTPPFWTWNTQRSNLELVQHAIDVFVYAIIHDWWLEELYSGRYEVWFPTEFVSRKANLTAYAANNGAVWLYIVCIYVCGMLYACCI